MNQPANLRRFLRIPLVLACFALWSTAQAVMPAPDGGYSGKNTAEGEDAPFSLTYIENTDLGSRNTAIGLDALYHDSTVFYNMAIRLETLYTNPIAPYNTALRANSLYNIPD